jgi:hypothetical protein
MQKDDDIPQDWQQPDTAAPGAPYESVADDAPAPQDEPLDATEPQGDAEVETSQAERADAVIEWQATEYVQHDRNASWFMVLAVVTLGLMAIAIFLMQSLSFAVLVPVMAAALVVYVKRPPALINYTVSRKGVHVNDRLHAYEEFRSFGVLSHDDVHAIVLVPRKRFQLSLTLYFPEEVGEGLVDMLAARLPMNEVKQDAVDRFLARLRL